MAQPSMAISLHPAQQAASVVNIAMTVATAAYSGQGADTMALEGLLSQLKRSSLDLPLMQAVPAMRKSPALRMTSASAPVSVALNAAMVQRAVSTNRAAQVAGITMPEGSTIRSQSIGPQPTPKGIHQSVTAPHVGQTSVTAPRIKENKS